METYRRVLYSPSAVNLAVVEDVSDSEVVEACELKWRPSTVCKKKHKDNSQRHLANIHDINIEWFYSHMCKYKSTRHDNLNMEHANSGFGHGNEQRTTLAASRH